MTILGQLKFFNLTFDQPFFKKFYKNKNWKMFNHQYESDSSKRYYPDSFELNILVHYLKNKI